MKRTLTAILASIIIFGCVSEKDASDVILLIDQSAYTASEGETVRFEIETWTIHDRMDRIEISSYDSERGKTDLDTLALSDKRQTVEYFYKVPESESDSLTVELSFTAYDNQAHSQKVTTFVHIVSKDAVLSEAATSVTIYSPASGKPDGFSLLTLQPVYASSTEDSDADICVPESSDPGQLSDKWKSKSGLKFAKMTGVDYPTITRNRLWALYSNALKAESVNDIETGDVIMIGTDLSVIGIILVTGVYDEEGSGNDRYMFNIKMM
ncbi:MAG TPA: hypothetical protein IAC04_04295 [Candidatus Coprenecus stercoravium]|uniref:Lipoprotein n=1 Tax=Candidatus Coprenecus stercoravium TaxID=2840735 RepID=A0A9D2GP79_9BACT|nr:hypothetical protein [Candidatus Coprenecus stercoravium]